MLATLAFEQHAGPVAIDAKATAARADGIAVGRSPSDALENVLRFLARKPSDLSEAKAPCGFREKEMLRHGKANPLG